MKKVNVSTKAKTLILRSPEGHEFILAEIDDFNREIELTRQNKALMKLLDQRGRQRRTLRARGEGATWTGIEVLFAMEAQC